MIKPFLLLLSALTAIGSESDIPEKIRASAERYPKLESIPKELVYPRGASFRVDRDGNFVVDGKIRWLLGVQPPKGYSEMDILPTPGYPPSLQWIYEQTLNYENAQRLGIDSIAPYPSNAFLEKILPGSTSPQNRGTVRTNHQLGDSGLPLMVDFTATPWDRGILNSTKKPWRGLLPQEALNEFHQSGVNHWVPYNTHHPEARKVYRTYWEDGFEELTRKSPIICYELFNEPGYDDSGEYNRKRFLVYLKEKYSSVSEMNRIWKSSYDSFESASRFRRKNENAGLAVEWSKFMEESFTDLCRFGAAVIRAKRPDARIGMQPCGGSHFRQITRNYVNSWAVNRFLNTVVLPTGGGTTTSGMDLPADRVLETTANSPYVGDGFLQRHFFRALADGKPIVNSELYVGISADQIARALWMDMLRGASVSYAFEWTKRAWNWKPRTKEGGLRRKEIAPYQMLNPYAETELWGLMRAKKEIFRFAPWFVPRARHNGSEVAILVSFPTERRGEATGNSVRNEVASYASALAFSHIPADAILEEQLAEGRQNRYKVILAAGVSNVYAGTPEHLLTFVKNGGTLILARGLMNEDEYGHPMVWKENAWNLPVRKNPAASTDVIRSVFPEDPLFSGVRKGRNDLEVLSAPGWKPLAFIGKSPVLLSKKLGRGTLYVLTPEMQDYTIASLLLPILKEQNVEPEFQILRAKEHDLAVNVELHKGVHDGKTLCVLINHDRYPKLVSIRSRNLSAGREAAELLGNRKLAHRNGISDPLCLPGSGYLVFGVADGGALEAAFGPLKKTTLEQEERRYEAAMEKHRLELERTAGTKFRYRPNLSRVRTLDLRKFCNRGFMDASADDGKGGWTDQGPDNSLQGVPWGIHNLLGVPCDLIRFDENNDKTCIVLSSKSQKGVLPSVVGDIPVGGKIRALYFFHTAGWPGGPAMTYRIHYVSGKTLDVPVLTGRDIGNWWTSHDAKMRKFMAWENRLGRGFYCMEWVNPHPEDEIRSLDIVSPDAKIIPIVIGISAEEYLPETSLSWLSLKGYAHSRAGIRFEGPLAETSVNADTGNWAGFLIAPTELTQRFPIRPGAVLRFRINGGKNRFGSPSGGQVLRLKLCNFEKGNMIPSGAVSVNSFLEGGRIDTLPDSWQEVTIPLDQFGNLKKMNGRIDSLLFQFENCGHVSGVRIKDVSLRFPDR